MRKVLIANRGEIAIRAARAARELGVSSVAVFSYEDRSALHRQEADEAYQIGEPGHPVRSYLDIDALIGIARTAGADAVYPGYGFLSESAVFAQAVVDSGLTWVGPSPTTLVLTGDKVRARESAERAGVAVLAASGPVSTAEEAVAQAETIGFPVFVKASGGGGGRGLRRVESADEVRAVFEVARREAEAAFGDDTLFVEQAVIRPRHVEVQILADAAGNVVHLFERDCSVQRRHQKVVEIAPAPGLPRQLIDALCADAVAFAREVGYRSAGTVEFLVWADPSGRAARSVSGFGYAFIEMNPRIQVEHTVTEEVTGAALGSLRGVLSLTIYAVAGVLGIPWFAEGSSGFSSPSFGYIIGFILAALIVGRIAEHGATQSVARSAGLMLVGNLVIYAVGVCWLKFAIDADWATAIALGLTPFVVGDAIKIAAAAGLLPIAWSCLRKVGLVT